MSKFKIQFSTFLIAGFFTSICLVGGASADNPNFLSLNIEGDDNSLYIIQEHVPNADGSVSANRVDIDVIGDRNGSARHDRTSPMLETLELAPGEVAQRGTGNQLNLSVIGSDNLFAMSQAGHNNNISGDVSGMLNAVAVVQYGNGNSTSFSQAGRSNSIVITQRSF